ncbi:MAG: hypothetical protein AAF849_16915 [Bacteroidota bacterium]
MIKRISILLFAVLFVSSTAFAQDGKKAMKEATRALNSFTLGGASDGEKLKEAVDAIDVAVNDPEFGKTSKAWTTRGNIYNAVINLYTTQSFTDESATILDKAAPAKAYTSFQKALEFAEKKWEKKDALKGLSEGISNLNNTGFSAYEAGDYATAYENFSKVLAIHKTLKDNGEGSGLDDPTAYNDQVYTTGLAALNSGNTEAAGPLFEELEANNFEQASLYSALYKINRESDPEKALKYLEKGRKEYPSDVALLFDEINHYLSAGQMDVLEDRLKEAIKQEPDNPSLYYTLGRVYSDVSDKKKAEGDMEAEQEYFNKAIEQFNAALEKKDDFYEAMYGIGEMYYNRAAVISKEMQELGTSKEEQKKYETLDTEMKAIFDKALPYFQKAEKLNPNDNNTLVALSEIYARKNDFEKVSEFKARIKNLQEGGTNESFFLNN